MAGGGSWLPMEHHGAADRVLETEIPAQPKMSAGCVCSIVGWGGGVRKLSMTAVVP